jgi:hypothetical protein
MTRALAFFLIAAGCTPAAEPAAGPGPAAQETAAMACDLEIRFGSYAMGIDRGALERVRQLLADRGVRKVEEQGWGREGEVTLCARTRSAADAERLFESVTNALPKAPHGPIHVRTASGLRFDAPPR